MSGQIWSSSLTIKSVPAMTITSFHSNISTTTSYVLTCGLATMSSQWKPLWGHCSIAQKMKLCIYNTLVLSILLYGEEVWFLSKTLAKRTDSFDSRALGAIKDICWHHHVSNKELHACTHTSACSFPPHSFPSQALVWICPLYSAWSTHQGFTLVQCSRPHTRWPDMIKKDLQRLDVTLEDAESLPWDCQ